MAGAIQHVFQVQYVYVYVYVHDIKKKVYL